MCRVLIDSQGASAFVRLCAGDIDYSLFFATGCIEIYNIIGGDIVCGVHLRPDATDPVCPEQRRRDNAPVLRRDSWRGSAPESVNTK